MILRGRCNGRLNGFQQQIVFDSLIALSGVPEAMIAKGFCFQIERIARILTIWRPLQSWLLKC